MLESHSKLVALAREIAIGHKDIQTILDAYAVSSEDWEYLKTNPEFIRLLEAELTAWQSALNTQQRTKYKAAALIEEWLPEANARVHDPKEQLSAKVELAKLIARIGEMGVANAQVAGTGERFKITINMGAANQVKFEKEVTPQVIEAQAEGD